MSWLGIRDFRNVARRVPILCVDGVIRDDRGKYLLVKRTSEPLQNHWWVPGGRVFKDEPLERAFTRKMREELGSRVRSVAAVGYFELRYRSRRLGGIVHAVSVVFDAKLFNLDIVLDKQSADWGFFDRLPARFRVRTFVGVAPG